MTSPASPTYPAPLWEWSYLPNWFIVCFHRYTSIHLFICFVDVRKVFNLYIDEKDGICRSTSWVKVTVTVAVA